MSNTAGETIRPIAWADRSSAPVEIRHRNELLADFSPYYLSFAERLEFHVVLVGVSGTGLHEIDFVETEIRPRRVAHIAPGQVHRWRADEDFEAILVLCPEAPVDLTPDWRLGSATHDLDDEQWASLEHVLELHQRIESAPPERPVGRSVALRSVRDLLFVTLGLFQEHSAHDAPLPLPYVAFRDDLEAHLSVASSMEERASRLGYSTRTISRACQQVAGRTAKQLFDERIALEARRRLSQPQATSASVAATLGFTEPTNFAKFFRRLTGESPSEWADSASA